MVFPEIKEYFLNGVQTLRKLSQNELDYLLENKKQQLAKERVEFLKSALDSCYFFKSYNFEKMWLFVFRSDKFGIKLFPFK